MNSDKCVFFSHSRLVLTIERSGVQEPLEHDSLASYSPHVSCQTCKVRGYVRHSTSSTPLVARSPDFVVIGISRD